MQNGGHKRGKPLPKTSNSIFCMKKFETTSTFCMKVFTQLPIVVLTLIQKSKIKRMENIQRTPRISYFRYIVSVDPR